MDVCGVPAEYRDYSALHLREPSLAYLRPIADIFSTLEPVSGSSALSAVAGDVAAGSAESADKINSSMLLLPKRKVEETCGGAAIEGSGGTQPKRPLIEEISSTTTTISERNGADTACIDTTTTEHTHSDGAQQEDAHITQQIEKLSILDTKKL